MYRSLVNLNETDTFLSSFSSLASHLTIKHHFYVMIVIIKNCCYYKNYINHTRFVELSLLHFFIYVWLLFFLIISSFYPFPTKNITFITFTVRYEIFCVDQRESLIFLLGSRFLNCHFFVFPFSFYKLLERHISNKEDRNAYTNYRKQQFWHKRVNI